MLRIASSTFWPSARTLEQVRRPNEATMGDRQPQVGDARLEVVLEAGERPRPAIAAFVGGALTCDAGGPVAGSYRPEHGCDRRLAVFPRCEKVGREERRVLRGGGFR